MLDTMRHIAGSVVAKALLFFLVITFAVWGVGDILRNSGASYAAKVGGETISVAEFQHSKALMERQLQAMGMSSIPPQQLEVMVLRQLVQQRLILQTARDLGLYVNDALLATTLRTQPQFMGKDGKFSREQFAQTLQARQMSEGYYLSQLKQETAGGFLLASLDMADVTPPSSVLTLSTVAGNETRDAVLVTIPARSDAAITDAALQEYYDSNKTALYMQPELRTLEYVSLTQADINALVDHAITEEMMKDAQTSRPTVAKSLIMDQLRSEQRDQVMRDLSNNVEDALAAGSSMGDALAKAGVHAPSRQLTNIEAAAATESSDEVTKTVAEQGFSLSEGEVSGLITTPKGAVLMVSVKTVTPASPKPFDAVKSDVRNRLAKQLARDAARSKAQEVKAALAKEPNWQAALAPFNLAGHAVSHLPRPVEGKTNSAVPPALQQAIFEHPAGDVAGPMSLENGDQMIAVVLEIHHPTPNFAATPDEKTVKQLAQTLSKNVEIGAMNAFMAKHKVKVNPQLFSKPSEAE